MTSFGKFLKDNRFDDQAVVYDYFFQSIRSRAADCEIDLAFGDFSPYSDGVKLKGKNLAVLDKSLKGKVFALLRQQEKQVENEFFRFPFFRFNNRKGAESSFSTYSALWELYKSQKPVDTSKPRYTAHVRKVDDKDDELRRKKWLSEQIGLWGQQLAGGSSLLNESLYLQRKFGDLVDKASDVLVSAGVRRVQDEKGCCLLVALRNSKGETVGFQKIYDEKVNFAKAGEEADLRDKDYRFLDKAKTGSFIQLGQAKKTDDYVFIAEGLATGLTVHLATNKAVFVAMDATNLDAVLVVVKGLGYKRPVIAADNDVSSKGNAGVYAALKAAKTHGARIFVPSLNDAKVDFNDLLMAEGLDVVKKQLVFRHNQHEIVPNKNVFLGAVQLLRYCPSQQAKKQAWVCCACAVSNLFSMEMEDAKTHIKAVLQARGVVLDVDTMTARALVKAMKRTQSKNAAHFGDFDEVVDCTHLTNDAIANRVMANKGIWLDNRCMGKGKTLNMGYVLGMASNAGLTSSYICHRQSLVANSSYRIKAVSYKLLNRHDALYEDAIALCVNSVVNPRFYDYVTTSNVLFIDEIRQTLEHVAIGSVRSEERKAVYEGLITAIKQADIVLGCDADLNQLTVDWLRHNFPEKKFFGLTSQFVKPKATIHYGVYEAVFNKAVETALSKVPTLIQCDSIKATKTLFEAVNRPHLKVLVVNSENKADIDQARFLLNPNDEIKHYDVVIHSPVIGSGVSITCDYVKAHFGLFRGVLAENECLQMLGRNRPSTDIYVGFNDKHVKNRVSSAKTLFDGELLGRARVIDGEVVIDPLDKLRMKITSRHNDSLNDIENQALLLFMAKGYDIKRFEGDESIETLRVSRAKAREVHCDGVIEAEIITASDAYKLEKAESITQKESYQLERFNATYELALPSTEPITEEDVVFYDSGRVVKVIHNREIAHATPDQRKAVDERQGGFRSVAKGFHIDVVLSLLKDRMVDQYHASLLLNYLNKNNAELAACGLGNYSKPSKYPIRTLNEFLERFGYGLVARKISSGARKGDRVYKLKSDERIDAIVARRSLQNVFKAAAVADGD